MSGIDGLLAKRHDGDIYQCGHFVRDCWRELLGRELPAAFEAFLLPDGHRTALQELRGTFERLDSPQSPCICVYRRMKGRPHVGMYWRGRVLEITQMGAKYVPPHVIEMRFNAVRYYRPIYER